MNAKIYWKDPAVFYSKYSKVHLKMLYLDLKVFEVAATTWTDDDALNLKFRFNWPSKLFCLLGISSDNRVTVGESIEDR